MKKILIFLFLFFSTFIFSQTADVEISVIAEEGWNEPDSVQIYGRYAENQLPVIIFFENDLGQYDPVEGLVVIYSNLLPCMAEYEFYRKETYVDGEFVWVDITNRWTFTLSLVISNDGTSHCIAIADYLDE